MSFRQTGALGALGLVVLSLAASVCEAQTIAGRNGLPTARMLAPLGLERAWWIQATLNSFRDKVRYLTADEDVVIVQASSGMITAIDAETGRRRWAIQLGRTDQASFRVVTNDQYCLFVVGTMLYAVDRVKGNIDWEIRIPSQPSTSPATDQERIYIGAIDGSMYAFDLRKIKKLYEENLLPQYSHETLLWRYKTAREITSPAISDGSRVSFASLDKSLYTVTAGRRDLIFQFETDSPIAAPLAHKDNWIYLASQDYKFYCVNALNGSVRWEFITGHPVRTAPRIVQNRVFLLPDHGGLFCLDADNGRELWRRPKLVEYVATSPAYHYAIDDQDNFAVLNRETGTPVGLLPLREFKIRIANERTDRIFLSTEAGLICSIRQIGREWPQYHMYPEKRPIVPLFTEPEAEATEAPAEGTNEAAPNANENQ